MVDITKYHQPKGNGPQTYAEQLHTDAVTLGALDLVQVEAGLKESYRRSLVSPSEEATSTYGLYEEEFLRRGQNPGYAKWHINQLRANVERQIELEEMGVPAVNGVGIAKK